MGVTSIFVQQVFPHFEVPQKVISDQDTRFTLEFTKELCRLLDINQNISTVYHPQTDGQLERTNQWLEHYLRVYCNFQQDNWLDLLPMAQYVHNSWVSHTMGFTPFELLIRFTPQICPISTTSSHVPSLEQRKQFLEELRGRAQEAIKHA